MYEPSALTYLTAVALNWLAHTASVAAGVWLALRLWERGIEPRSGRER